MKGTALYGVQRCPVNSRPKFDNDLKKNDYESGGGFQYSTVLRYGDMGNEDTRDTRGILRIMVLRERCTVQINPDKP